jgi:hypothetical protein
MVRLPNTQLLASILVTLVNVEVSERGLLDRDGVIGDVGIIFAGWVVFGEH